MTKKLYRMPANENELSENGQLEIMVSANRFDMEITWECKNPVTAYNRFRKAYLQAVEDGAIPATLAAGVAKNFGLPEKVKAVKDEFGATIAFVDASENVGDQVTVSWDRNHFFVEDNEESFYICMLIDGEEIENYADIEKTYTEDAVVETEQEEETTMAIENMTPEQKIAAKIVDTLDNTELELAFTEKKDNRTVKHFTCKANPAVSIVEVCFDDGSVDYIDINNGEKSLRYDFETDPFKKEIEINPEEYAISPEALGAAVEAETELANSTFKLRISPQDGRKARAIIMNPDRLKVIFADGTYKFQRFHNPARVFVTIAKYNTADEVNQVIDMLTAAVNHGNKSFKFPTFDNGFSSADVAEIQKDLVAPTDRPEPATEADTDDVFDLLPTLDELNDFTETDPWLIDDDAEYTERDARFNRGERHAAKLQKELREVDPTVEVTYGIDDEDDRDFFHMRFDGIFGGRYGTVAAVKETFYRLKADIAEAKAELAKANTTPKTHAAAVTADLNGFYTPLYDNPELRITPIADGKQLHPAAKWFVGYDDFSKRYGIWSEYGWHVSGFSAGRDFCGWIEPDKLDDTIRRLKAAITRGDKTFDFADKPATKLEVLKAKRDAAWENVINTQAALLKAHDAHIAAENDFDAADIAYRYAAADMACDLNAKLDLPIDTLDVTTQGGLNWIIALDKIEVTFDDDAFKFHCELSDGTDFTLGTYDTPERVEKVINLLKTAVTRGDIEFTFQTVDELNQPDAANLRDSLKRAMNIALANYRDFCRLNNLTAAEHELKLYNICRKALKEVA